MSEAVERRVLDILGHPALDGLAHHVLHRQASSSTAFHAGRGRRPAGIPRAGAAVARTAGPAGRRASLLASLRIASERFLSLRNRAGQIGQGQQHTAKFRAINPNGRSRCRRSLIPMGRAGPELRVSTRPRYPALSRRSRQTDGLARRSGRVAVLAVLAQGLRPFSGQAVHFQRATPEKLPYAINRYRREAERHYTVLDKHLAGQRVHRRQGLHDRRHLRLGLG